MVTAAFGCASEETFVVADGIFAELGAPLPSATQEQIAAFERGREAAARRFTPAEGLGPEFNVTFCASCHEKPVLGGGASHYRDFLLVGDELLPGTVVPRGKNGVQRQFSLESGRAPSDPLANISATRNPIPFFGAGLLAEIPDTEILELADPDDDDGDGVSGRVNYDGSVVGRFGRKAQTARIELFIRGPLFNHLGITSNPLSNDRRRELPRFEGASAFAPHDAIVGVDAVIAAQAVIPDEPTVDLDDVPDPEISESELFDLVSFSLLLAAPAPDAPTPATERGERSFLRIGCAKCHVPSLRGPRGAIPAYTDLLVHDMGDELADGFPMGQASGREFRTQPLWGITAVSPYLHDGRAATLEEAIRWHGGEAESIRDAYLALDPEEKRDLIAFLESLGGAAQKTAGSLPPGEELPRPGEYGAPLADLDAEQEAQFERGRALFDRDFSYGEGVGPTFNGDACRSCHFDPVIGGAGPSGVDVIRQGIFSGFSFSAPDAGTALSRHAIDGRRPEADVAANFFEPRQTPSTLGLGLLERIPRATIEALADPDDEDGDGVAGRAHVLDSGELGRFGWKASVPSLREFVRDALSGELGITLPDEPGFSRGVLQDEDGIMDPEVDALTIDRLTAFLALLAPPPRNQVDLVAEAEGERVFVEVGCALCHVPLLETEDGTEVRAYTDLLLHDVAESDSLGIEEGDAGIRELRTPPLWGISRTAPYFHDGRAATLREAIDAHAGEASAARDRVVELTEARKAALLAFLRSL
ncbi:MAG TPA: di-heme oxidoredictase family protein [Polyangiales bacterium]|nr:di-heme oxidoredictase family protein [Polyangiales bacterium]